jgi:Ca-activated chloride channel family protein
VIRRFETMDDLPIRAGLVLDTSLSMENELEEVEKAAYRFLETVLQPRDRACLITFADEPQLAVRFTNDPSILAGGLSGLVAEGETALYDSVIYALHYFAGLKGKRAIIVLTDGEDSKSRYSYEEAVEFARRTGASIYVIGLGLSSSDPEVRAKLAGLTKETGGELFFIDSARNLGRVYETIQHDLRSQYLLAYQSSAAMSADEYRKVEIRVKRKGLEAKSLRGYYP